MTCKNSEMIVTNIDRAVNISFNDNCQIYREECVFIIQMFSIKIKIEFFISKAFSYRNQNTAVCTASTGFCVMQT